MEVVQNMIGTVRKIPEGNCRKGDERVRYKVLAMEGEHPQNGILMKVMMLVGIDRYLVLMPYNHLINYPIADDVNPILWEIH